MSIPGLDAWITGGQYHTATMWEDCRFGHAWEVEGEVEYGVFMPIDEEGYMKCPECGHYSKSYLQYQQAMRRFDRQMRERRKKE